MTFPAAPINVLVQILVDGAWIDITPYVYARNDIIISGRGRPNESQSVNPCDMTLTLNNINGTFSPNNTQSPYYPDIQTNTQIRVVINTQSASGLAYYGYRFWGEVRKWPPNWDTTGTDIWVDITASGILTRYIQGDNIGSALKRFYSRKTDDTRPIAGWMCEELTGATQFSSVVGGNAMTWTGSPNLSSDSSILGVDPIPQFNGSIWTGNTGSYSKAGPVTFNRPGYYAWKCPGAVTSVSAQAWGAGGGGGNGGNGDSGGGGQWVQNTAMPVTPGTYYPVIVGKGGDGGVGSNSVESPGGDGQSSWFAGDSSLISAAGGTGATGAGVGLGGTGGTGVTSFNGGNGNVGAAGGGGAGGGGSGGSTGAGGLGHAGSGIHGGASGSAGTGGGGVGGTGGTSTAIRPGPVLLPIPGGSPGGGGGGGSWNGIFAPVRGPGSSGAPGKVILNYTPTTVPNDVVVRFVINVPKGGMPNGAIVMKCTVASGTLARTECYYTNTFNGDLRYRGFNGSNVQIFDTLGPFIGINGAGPLCVSLEMQKSGTNVNCVTNIGQINARDNAHVAGPVSFAGTLGAISQIVANPGGNIMDTACGAIVLQYDLESFVPGVSTAAVGYNGELAVDRLARLCAEESVPVVAIQADGYWSFADGTAGGWTTTNATTVPNFTTWSSVGVNSLLIDITTASAVYSATSPLMPCLAGQSISARADVNSLGYPAAFELDITYYNSSKVAISTTVGPVFTSRINNQQFTLNNLFTVVAGVNPRVAPSGTAYVAVTVKNNNASSPAGSQFAIDNVSITLDGQMGPQLDRTFMELIQEVEDFDRGLITEARDFLGIRYRTRKNLQNQISALTLDYKHTDVAQITQPIFDEQLIRNNVTVTRTNGSIDNDTLSSGPLSVMVPPDGVGNYPYSLTVNCFSDSQIPSIADWILTVGTVNEYRFPSITVNQARAAGQNRPYLDVADGTFESGVAGWVASGGTVAQNASQHYMGSFSAFCSIVGTPSQYTLRPTAANYIPVSPLAQYSATMWVFPASGTPIFLACIDWYDVTKTYISTSSVSYGTAGGQWNGLTVTGTAPSNAAWCNPGPSWQSPPASTFFYADEVHVQFPAGQPFSAAAFADCGDHIQIINLPSWLPNPTIDQLAYSFDEAINAFRWNIAMVGVPESEYTGSGFPVW